MDDRDTLDLKDIVYERARRAYEDFLSTLGSDDNPVSDPWDTFVAGWNSALIASDSLKIEDKDATPTTQAPSPLLDALTMQSALSPHPRKHNTGSRWTHAICLSCWHKQNPTFRTPARVAHPELDYCCFCGGDTQDGIFLRYDPGDLPFCDAELG